jgi:hypothetical protein
MNTPLEDNIAKRFGVLPIFSALPPPNQLLPKTSGGLLSSLIWTTRCRPCSRNGFLCICPDFAKSDTALPGTSDSWRG